MQPLAGQFRTVQAHSGRVAAPVPPQQRRKVDPAPTRWRYKVNRWLLSPLFRATLRVGLPAFLLAVLVLSFLSNDAAMSRLNGMISDAQTAVAARPEYQITDLAITGASPRLQREVTAELALDLPLSGLDIDLDRKRADVLAIPSVSQAHLSLAPGGTITVEVEEIPAVALWRRDEGLAQIAADGTVLRSSVRRQDTPDLPLIAGDGAQNQLASLAAIVPEATPLAADIRGYVWVGERRWDIVLSHDRRIALPEDNPIAALRRILVLDQSRGLFDRDVSLIDFRNPHRPAIRLRASAVAELRAARGVSIEGFSQ